MQKMTGIAMTVIVTGLLTWAGASIVERNETMAKLSERVAVMATEMTHMKERISDLVREIERIRPRSP